MRVIKRGLSYKSILSWYSGLVKPKPLSPPYRHIVQIGDPILRTPAQHLPLNLINTPEIQFIINRMKNVFKAYNCLGLAAPQVGLSYRIIMFQISSEDLKSFGETVCKTKGIKLTPLTVVINPEMKVKDFKKITFSESCGSVKGFKGDVARYNAIELNGIDENGEEIQMEAQGWLSRVIQHEMDHINGIMYTDKMDRKSFSCGCWHVVNERNGKVELPFGPV